MAIRVDARTLDALQRHAERTAYAVMLERSGDAEGASEVVSQQEFLERQRALVEAFLPIVVQLVRAGLVTAEVKHDPDNPDDCKDLVGLATFAGRRDDRIHVKAQS